MAGRDNVLFIGTAAVGTAAGTVVPLSLAYGIENVRQGYGTAKLKNIRGYFLGGGSSYGASAGIPVSIKNSNWIDEAGLIAQMITAETSFNRDNLSFMRGRDKELAQNTSWMINATLPYAVATTALNIYILLEIEYSDVAGINAENAAGSPVMKKCSNAAVTAAANTLVNIGSFDNLLQGVQYVMSEVSLMSATPGFTGFVIVEGFSNQRGLTRIIPARDHGEVDQLEGSVILTKQTYGVSVIAPGGLSAAPVTVSFEMIANKN